MDEATHNPTDRMTDEQVSIQIGGTKFDVSREEACALLADLRKKLAANRRVIEKRITPPSYWGFQVEYTTYDDGTMTGRQL